jgi:hypothetical protein
MVAPYRPAHSGGGTGRAPRFLRIDGERLAGGNEPAFLP